MLPSFQQLFWRHAQSPVGCLDQTKQGAPGLRLILSSWVYCLAEMPTQVEVIIEKATDASWEQVGSGESRWFLLEKTWHFQKWIGDIIWNFRQCSNKIAQSKHIGWCGKLYFHMYHRNQSVYTQVRRHSSYIFFFEAKKSWEYWGFELIWANFTCFSEIYTIEY